MDKRTRGKTRPGRLDRLDALLPLLLGETFFEAESALYVDFGFGATSHTADAFFDAIAQLAPSPRLLGVEWERGRVEEAEARSTHAGARWMQGGFGFELGEERVRMMRAMNVLRQYDAARCEQAHEELGAHLEEGGVLLEGSCDRGGERLGLHVLRRREGRLVREALLLLVAPGVSFAPRMMRDWLPQDLRRGLPATHPVHARLLDPWMRHFIAAGEEQSSPQARFEQSVTRLAGELEGICLEPRLLRHGALLWRPEEGVPRRDDTMI